MCEEIRKLIKDKRVWIPLCLTAVLSYGYLWTHPSMGVDDTAMTRYFVEGFAPHLGRWTIFVLGKIFRMIEFTPLVTDFIGVVLMGLSTLMIGVILRKSSQGRLSVGACSAFGCFFLSYSLINEVYVYYLHNGIGMAYVMTVMAYYLLRFGEKKRELAGAIGLLTLALGCYETFAEVFLLLLFADTLIRFAFDKEGVKGRQWGWLFLKSCFVIVAAMLIRNGIDQLILRIIDVEPYLHSIGKEIGWLFSPEAGSTLLSMIRTFGRYYILNATVNYAVAMFWVAMLVLFCFGIWVSVRKKSWLCVLNLLGVLGISWVISIIEGSVGAYRTMQTFPILVGLAMLLVFHWLEQKPHRGLVKRAGFVVLFILLYNQVYETNKWYYVDYMKYQEEAAICRQMAYDLEREATLDKPLVFVGRITDYGTLDTYAYVDNDSWQYQLFSRLDGSGEADKKYEIVQNLAWYSVFDWGVDAFDEQATEIANFFAYHGYPIQVATREEKAEVEGYADNMTVWPKEGSILELENCVIVKLGETE